MPEIKTYEFKDGVKIGESTRTISDEDAKLMTEEKSVSEELLQKGATILANWDNLTAAQVKAVTKALLRYVLWKEGK